MESDKKRKIGDPRNEDSKWRDEAPVYKIFYKIDHAYDFSVKKGLLPLFALDKSNPKNQGSKVFVVAGYDRFYAKYASMKPEERCFYETILPLPCHLHVDAEYIREKNPSKDQKWIDSTIRDEIILFMIELGIIKSADMVKVLALDSSNVKKFSKHYLFIMKDGTRFKNNYHCGAFMRRLKNRMLKKYGEDRNTNPLFAWSVRKKESEQNDPEKALDLVMDICVYTFRRQFRLLGSTKRLGPYRPLLLEGDDNNNFHLSKDLFYGSLIQRIDDYSTLKLVQCLEENGEEPVSTSRKREKGDRLRTRLNYPSQGVISSRESFRSDPPPPFMSRLGRHLADLWQRKTGSGCDLRFSYYSSEYQTMRFESSSKFCLIKGEPHTGNHVWFRVYLRTCTFVQGCYSEKTSCTSSEGERLLTERMELDLPEDLRLEVEAHAGKSRRRGDPTPIIAGFLNHMEYLSYVKEEDKRLCL